MTEAEQFSLRWNNFHSNLTEGFHSLLEEVDLVDVTLAAEGQYLQAHKIVLSVCSPYFKQLFKANPCKHPIVILKDVCHKDLEALLHFMYQGEVNVRQEELAPFLKTAEMLQIKGLTGNDSKSTDSSQPQSPAPPSVPQRPFKRQRTDSPVDSPLPLPLPPAPAPAPAQLSPPIPLPAPASAPVLVPVPAPAPAPVPECASPIEEVATKLAGRLAAPKQEPLDYDLEAEENHTAGAGSPADLVQLLQGEASQPPGLPPGPPPPPGLFGSLASLPQDLAPDAPQGLSERKVMQVLSHELHLTALRNRSNNRLRRRCVFCYELNRKILGNHAANQKTQKVSTFCATCRSNPFMCSSCFKRHVNFPS